MTQHTAQAAPRSSLAPLVACVAALAAGFWCAAQGGLWSEGGEDGVLIASGVLLDSVLPLAAVLFAAAGMGGPILRWLGGSAPMPAMSRIGRVGLQCAVGLMAFMLLAWLLAWGGFLNRGATLSLCGVGGALLIMQALAFRGAKSKIQLPRPPLALILSMPALGVALFACTCPPGTLWRIEAWGYDVTSYHLQIPREWLDAGRMIPLRHNVYSFLPNLAETTYAHLGAIVGSVCDAAYVAQLFHLSAGVITAMIIVGMIESQLVAPGESGAAQPAPNPLTAGLFVAAVFLAMPWTIITGTLAYDEMFVLCFAAAALQITLDTRWPLMRAAITSGVLAGAATLAKLPAGPMVALPISLAWCHRAWLARHETPRLRISLAPAMALACLLTLMPYFARNHAWTGNPVFPFAAEQLGMGHWTEFEVARWNAGHHATGSAAHRVSELGRRWFCNLGYGAFGGQKADAEPGKPRELAVFNLEWGVPVFWPLAIAAGVGVGCRPRHRPAVVALGLMLACQLIFWLTATHLQSRFLLPSLLPGVVLLGLSVTLFHGPLRSIPYLLMLSLAAALTIQTQVSLVEQLFFPTAPWHFSGTLPTSNEPIKTDDTGLLSHPINTKVGHGSKVLLIADAARLLYLRTPVSYHSAFDREPLGDIMRASNMNAAAVTAELRRKQFTHVWVHYAELRRLRESYGYDPDVTEQALQRLAKDGGWRSVFHAKGTVVLFELPTAQDDPPGRK